MAEVRGVLGAVDAADLGLVLPHEHLFNDLSSAVAEPSYASTRRLVEAEVGPGWQFLLRQDPYCCADNVAAKDHASVVREVAAFAAAGGGTVVDANRLAANGPETPSLGGVADASGGNFVLGNGWVQGKIDG
ncbi:phosphotriesterase-related protein, partial [Amycolatopsis sp. NPDC059090]